MTRVTVSTAGRVTLPKAIREKLRWPVGTRLMVKETSDGIVLKPAEEKKTRRLSDLVGSIKYEGPARSVKEMDAAIEKEFRRRHMRDRY